MPGSAALEREGWGAGCFAPTGKLGASPSWAVSDEGLWPSVAIALMLIT